MQGAQADPALGGRPASQRYTWRSEMPFCVKCGAQLRYGPFCERCGEPSHPAAHSREHGSVREGGLTENHLGALAYLTPIPAIALLVIEPWSRRPFLRFHSYQCLFLCLVAFLVTILTPLFAFIMPLNALFGTLAHLGILGMWAVAVHGAWRGEETFLPIIGQMARKQADGG